MKKSRKVPTLVCLDCGVIYRNGAILSRHVKKAHGYSSYDEYKIKHGLMKTPEELLAEGAVQCGICGMVSHELTSHITRTHKMTCEEYKEKYGKFQSEKYTQQQSERVKGENNPGYNHGGRLSPFSSKFIHADKIDQEDLRRRQAESLKNNGNATTTMAYWLKQGYSEDEAKEKLKERQTTFTLEKCIEKYGEEAGRQRWLDRQEKWQASFQQTADNCFSKVSQELFWKIYENLGNKDSVYFAELSEDKALDDSGRNNEYLLRLSDRVVLPDFYDESTKRIIEFDGTYWHGEHCIRHTNKDRDAQRDESLLKDGYEVLHIKEEDYLSNPDQVVDLCLSFLNGEVCRGNTN